MRGSVFKRCTAAARCAVTTAALPRCGSNAVNWAYRAYVGRDENGRWREQYRQRLPAQG
jgi:hypothetical protein